MAIDPSIALGYKGFEAPNPLAQYAQVAQIQNAQNQNALNQYQLAAAKRADEQTNVMNELYAKHFNPATGALNQNALNADLIARNQAGQIPVMQAKIADTEHKTYTAQKAKIDAVTEERKFFEGAQRNLATNPSNENVMAWAQDAQLSPVLSAETKARAKAEEQKLLAMKPAERATYLSQQGSTTSDFTARRGQNMVDARARENIDIARQRLEKDHAMLDPAEQAAISKAIIDGRLDPYKINGRNAKMMAQTLIAKPDINIKDLGIEAAGAGAAEKAIAGQSAKMSTAANEAGQMIGVVRNLSSQIDRTQYPSLNAIQNAVDKGTGGKEIVQLNTSINALVNSYARAISPTGQPTVSDKNHAREILNASYSNGQLGAILDTMSQEMSIAKSAAGEARAQLKAERTGKNTPAATNIDALLDKYKD
jgi:hypothetical protein